MLKFWIVTGTSLLCCTPAAADERTTFYIVRHAEKESGRNPNLTAAGKIRAKTLAQLLRSVELSAVYSTHYCRTVLTAQPVAHAASLPVQILKTATDPSLETCKPGIGNHTATLVQGSLSPKFVADVLSKHRGKNVLLVRHSNTVPTLVAALGGTLCPSFFPLTDNSCHLPSSQFDNLFVVTVQSKAPPHTQRLRFGTLTN